MFGQRHPCRILLFASIACCLLLGPGPAPTASADPPPSVPPATSAPAGVISPVPPARPRRVSAATDSARRAYRRWSMAGPRQGEP